MKIQILLQGYIFLSFLFFIGCVDKSEPLSDGLISFEMPKYLLIDEVLHFAKPAVDQIIEEEIAKIRTEENKEHLIDQIGFYCKDQFRLTVAYVSRYQNKRINKISDFVKSIASEQSSGKAYFSSHVDFFGKDKNAFIIKIDDQDRYLLSLNQKLRSQLHQINNDFYKKNNKYLYSIVKSEPFEYKPHVHLATLYMRSQARAEDRVLLESILTIIFQRVRNEVFPQVHHIIENAIDKKIEIDSLSFVDLTGRKVVTTEKLSYE